jgi:hypothetical protein
MQQSFISILATTPLRLDQDASEIFAIIPPSWGQHSQELTMVTTESPDKQIV